MVENRAQLTLFGGGCFPCFPTDALPWAGAPLLGRAENVEDCLNLGDDLHPIAAQALGEDVVDGGGGVLYGAGDPRWEKR